ncbi:MULTISPECIES: potassium channel family protein [Exiguobacterium]|uniref:potassium channel family protein n=1 Tax=Exiguobacterium TaxID=33986 RepID=UPI0006849F6B|nr:MULTISPECIES: potassium channel family protein [Exiguobacterium]MCK2157589.1 potassium channel family protein [Exiguobacterium sp. 17-1]
MVWLRFLRRMSFLRMRTLAYASFLFVFGVALIMYLAEPDTFGSYFRAVYWTMTTVVTVGYGDFFPNTDFGRFMTIFVFIFGIGIVGGLISKLVDGVQLIRNQKERGLLQVKETGHTLVFGYSRRSKHVIDELLETTDVILIDDLEREPFSHPRFHYVSGDPALDATLQRANIKKATRAIVLADHSIPPALADGRTLLIAASIERANPNIYTIVEMMLEEHLDSFEQVKVDEVLLGDETVARMAILAAYHPGVSKVVTNLLTKDGDGMFSLPAKPEWQTFRDAFHILLEDGVTILSDGKRLDLNRRLNEPIPPNTTLIVLCSEETAQRIGAV